MTIGLVTPYFQDKQTNDSGIANHCSFLALTLAELGHKVVVIHIRPSAEGESESAKSYKLGPNISVITCPIFLPTLINKLTKSRWAIKDALLKMKCMIAAPALLKKAISVHQIEVVETSSYFSLCYFCSKIFIPIPIAVRVSTTFSQMMHSYYSFHSKGLALIAKLEIKFIRKSRNLVTHAVSHAVELSALYGIDQKRFEVIPHGVKLPVLPIYNIFEKKSITILYVGRLEYRKGTDVLLAAIPIVLETHPFVNFNIIGNDPGNDYKRQFTEQNERHVLEQTIFSGRVSELELSHAYTNCDIFVAPSRYESFGLIYIEAMSYGKPVIGCNVGGVPEIIKNNQNGLFAHPGDIMSLVSQITRLIDEPVLRKRMGENARADVEENYSGCLLAERSLQYYTKLIKEFT